MATISEAMREAYASCPPDLDIYHTIELHHSTFDQPARLVANVADDMQFGIEDGAEVDGGELVDFIACPFESKFPEQRENEPPSTAISIDNVNRLLIPKIRAALSVREYLRVVYRNYTDDDLTIPGYGPVEFVLSNVTINGTKLTGRVTVGNLHNKRFPAMDKVYSFSKFRGLTP